MSRSFCVLQWFFSFACNSALSWILNNIPRVFCKIYFLVQIYFRWIVFFSFFSSLDFAVVNGGYILHVETWLCSATNLWIETQWLEHAIRKKGNNIPISCRYYGYWKYEQEKKKDRIGIKPLSTNDEQPTQVREHKTNTRKIAVFISMSKKFARTIVCNKLKLNNAITSIYILCWFSLFYIVSSSQCWYCSFFVFTFLY